MLFRSHIIKRMCDISVRIWRGSRLEKMGREALRPRIDKCDKENVAYFSKDLEGLQIGENGPGGTELQIGENGPGGTEAQN